MFLNDNSNKDEKYLKRTYLTRILLHANNIRHFFNRKLLILFFSLKTSEKLIKHCPNKKMGWSKNSPTNSNSPPPTLHLNLFETSEYFVKLS